MLKYDEYINIGGKCESAAFEHLYARAKAYIVYITNDRISGLKEIPFNVKLLITDMINLYAENDSNNQPNNISSYSNGIESISYNNKSDVESATYTKINKLIKMYLSNYPELLYRGRMPYDK